MNARAANVIVQQAQQSQKLNAKHDSTTKLFATGVVMAMTSDYCVDTRPVFIKDDAEPSNTHGPLWRVNVYNYNDVTPSQGKRCIPYLIKRGLMKRRPNGQMRLLVTEASAVNVKDLRDLLALNLYLDVQIAEGMEKIFANPDIEDDHVYRWSTENLPLAEDYVRDAVDEATAVQRLQGLVATKIFHVDLFEWPDWDDRQVTSLGFKYRELIDMDFFWSSSGVIEYFRLRTHYKLCGEPLDDLIPLTPEECRISNPS
eukprot:Blabericola_migrator_1__11063@NODE_643_length_7105_cov_97_345553_g472_i0_p2_GENE_NODE_643_length_7105_cov_97_345553_g472_i0NODE_643_length_7105_cov_97_345553_g472_i0_p2_ORF_typecomplete_len257_score36_64RuvB_C/PF05491_13/0_4_NODE_643_length_7105_cov_97_345553_g472_i041614931